MIGIVTKVFPMSKILRAYLHVYYRSKIAFLRLLVGDEAAACVLRSCLFPQMVLKIGKAKIGKNVRVGRWLTVHASKGSFKNLEIGNDVYLGKNLLIDLTERVTIGNRAGIGMNVTVITHADFGNSHLSEHYPPVAAQVEIMEDATVNWGCVINKGTRILSRALVLPGSVVSGMLKESCIYGGNPARLISRVCALPLNSSASAD